MRKTAAILALVMLYLVCSSKSCSDDTGQPGSPLAPMEATRDSIVSQFEQGVPGESTLQAFGETARQMVADWADYRTIAADTSYAQPFRDKASTMAARLFESEISAGLMESMIEPESVSSPDSVRIEQPLVRAPDSAYAGLLAIGRTILLPFRAERVDKVFGNDTIRAWEVRLGKPGIRK